MKNIQRVFIIFISIFFAFAVLAGCQSIIVTFDPDGGQIVSGDESVKYRGEGEVTAPVVEREGFLFAGWNIDFAVPVESITPKALWKKLYLLTFDIYPDNDEDNIVSLLTSEDKVVYPENPVREGYVFDGWDMEIQSLSEDTVISARWCKLYTVTFNLDGGSTSNSDLLVQSVPEGEAATAPSAEKTYMKPVKWDAEFDNVTSDITVNAIWERRELTSTEVAKLTSPATVEVNTYRRNNIEWSTGSGFFIDGEGTVVTNYHVIEDAYSIKVKLDDGEVFDVTHVVSFDKKLDIAILKINHKSPDYLEISDRELMKGEVVYAIGSSLGLEGTFTTGLVSTVSREIEGQNYIQISAAISSGNSGGPLIDAWGYVIGINTLTASAGQNLNFSIPISRLSELKEDKITVLDWFNKYSSLKWWIMERVINETNTGSGYSNQNIAEGYTVKGTHNKLTDEDVYSVIAPQLYDENGKQLKVDAYIYYYTEDFGLLMTLAIGCGIVSQTGTFSEDLEYEDYMIYEYGDGYLFCMSVYDIYGQGVNNSTKKFGVYLWNLQMDVVDYYLFVMYDSELNRDNYF